MRPAGPARSASGIARIVRTLAVTSSPRTPSPRVAPRTSRPSSYVSAMLRPSIFISATYATGVSPSPAPLRTRSSNALSSSSLYALSRLSIGTTCSTVLESVDGAARDALGRRIDGDEIGMLLLQAFELVEQIDRRLRRRSPARCGCSTALRDGGSLHEVRGCVGQALSLFTGAGAPPPARTDADASLRLRMAVARHGRGRF